MSRGVTKRRVQVVGGSTYTVSLPKEWARNVGLEPGSEVSIEVLPDYSLRIIPPRGSKPRGERCIEIVVTSENRDLAVLEILSAYLAGYNVIRVKYGDDVDPGVVHRIVSIAKSKALGLDMLEERANEVVLYSVIDPASFTIDRILEKMMYTTRFMLEDIGKNFVQVDENALRYVVERDDVVDKLFLLAMRQLNQVLAGEIDPSSIGIDILPQAMYLVLIAKNVERIADHAALIALNLIKAKGSEMLNELLKPFTTSKDVYIEAVKSYWSNDVRHAAKAVKLAHEAKVLEHEVGKKLANTPSPPELHLVLDSISRIRAYSIDIVESVMNMHKVREALSTKVAPQAKEEPA